jgi:hypothetical protein
VQLFDRARLLDCSYTGISAFRSLRDISGSLWTFLIVQVRWLFFCQLNCRMISGRTGGESHP